MKDAGGNDPIEKVIPYQYIHLSVASIGINTRPGLDKCASKSYADMICGTYLKTAEPEDPEIKMRCISGLVRLGKKALRVSGSSIQRCKAEANFFSCISGYTSDASR